MRDENSAHTGAGIPEGGYRIVGNSPQFEAVWRPLENLVNDRIPKLSFALHHHNRTQLRTYIPSYFWTRIVLEASVGVSSFFFFVSSGWSRRSQGWSPIFSIALLQRDHPWQSYGKSSLTWPTLWRSNSVFYWGVLLADNPCFDHHSCQLG